MSSDLILFAFSFIVLLWINTQLYRKDWDSRVLRRSMMPLFSSTPQKRLLKLRLIYGGLLLLNSLMVIICL